jgi:hypothetical protein
MVTTLKPGLVVADLAVAEYRIRCVRLAQWIRAEDVF